MSGDKKNNYRISKPKAMPFLWLLCAVVMLGFASIPWIILANAGFPSSKLALVFMALWSALPLGLAAYLVFLSTSQIDITGSPGMIRRHMRCAFVKRELVVSVDRAYLVRQNHYRKHGVVIRDVLYLRSGDRKLRLIDEMLCTDLPDLLEWIGRVAEVRCMDLRHRAPLKG